jgi:predicted nucleic-acid-binding protein
MISLDTNVVVRFLVKDDIAQSERAARVIRDALSSGETIYISEITLVETVWVLQRSYRFPKTEIIAIVKKLIAARGVRFSAADSVLATLSAFEKGRGGFADYFIREQSFTAGCTSVVTFDQALTGDTGYVVLPA